MKSVTDSELLFRFDPWADWVAQKRQELQQLDPAAGLSADLDIARLWLGIQQRLIESKPRRVIRSRRFVHSPDDEIPLLEIGRRVEQGRELNSFLSKQTRNPLQRDALLSDWGIHHLHLNLAGCGKTVSSHGEICTDQHISIQDQAFEGQIQ